METIWDYFPIINSIVGSWLNDRRVTVIIDKKPTTFKLIFVTDNKTHLKYGLSLLGFQ